MGICSGLDNQRIPCLRKYFFVTKNQRISNDRQMLQLFFAYLLLMIFFSLEFFLRKDKTAKSIDKTKSDNKSTRFIGLSFFIILIVSIIFNLLKIGRFDNNRLAITGLMVMVVGLLIRIWSMLTLSKYYTRTLLTIEKQEIVKKGPYRVIRHPGYLGTILVWGAAGLAMQNEIIFIVATIMILIVYFYRIENEEKMLIKQFGEKYSDYKKHSWRLIPLIW
jgi:protein-S-isoprenylcysteine O-methyltransferase Ste14